MFPGAATGLAHAALALASLVAESGTAPAEPGCPSAAAVWTGVGALVGQERVAAQDARPSLTLDDLGDKYRVTVAGRAHEYADPARDCERRAQVAAVFVGLTLWPLEMSAAPKPEPPPPAPPHRTVALELAPWLGLALASGHSGAAPAAGASLRAAVMGPAGRLGVVAGAGVSWPVSLELAGAPVQERRFPFDLGVRLRAGGAQLALTLDAAVVAALVRAGPGPSTWIDAGARAGARLDLAVASQLSIFIGVFAEASPRARELALEPDGVVGRASWLRAGGTFGISWKMSKPR
jgi:hypothetical protein